MGWFARQTPSEQPDIAPEEEGGIGLIDRDGTAKRRVLISALGGAAEEAGLRRTIARVAAEGRRPVVCATHLDMALLVEGPAAIELLPLRQDLHRLSDAEYAQYLDRRWEVLLAKWRIAEEITLGQDFPDFRAAQLAGG